MKHSYDKEQLEKAVKSSYTLADTLRRLNMSVSSNHYKTLRKKINEYKIDTSHFLGMAWGKNRLSKTKRELKDYLDNIYPISSDRLKKRLISEGIFSHICDICNNSTWNNLPIPIELHHINGNSFDNSIKNLQVLCPNCHAQTPNYSANKLKNHKPKKTKQIKLCLCGIEIRRNSKTCKQCFKNLKANNIPSKESLEAEISQHVSMVSVSRFYGVTDNAVRKWCRKYNIDYHNLLKFGLGGIEPLQHPPQ